MLQSIVQLAAAAASAVQGPDLERNLYFAQVAAASSALRLEEVAEARRWLDEAAPPARGWEWRYLMARADTSRRTIEAHGDVIYAIEYSPSGAVLATACGDGTVGLFDAADGSRLALLAGHEQAVYDVAFSPDGTRLASAGRDRTIRLWDAATHEARAVLRDPDSHVMSVAFSPDGSRLLCTMLSDAKIWNIERGEVERVLEGHVKKPPVVACDWSDDGRRLASGSWDNSVIIWDALEGRLLHKLGPGYGQGEYVQFKSVQFAPGGELLAAAGGDGSWRLWDADSGEERARVSGHTKECLAVAFDAGGRRLATAGQDNLVHLWDAQTQERLATLRGHTAPVRAVEHSPDGATLASGDASGRIKLWSADPAAYADSFKAHDNGPWGIAWTPDGRRLLTISSDKMLRVWDAGTRTLLRTLEGLTDQGASVACAPDGRRAISGSNDRTARVWDLESGATLFVSEPMSAQVWDVAWSQDGRHFAACANGKGVRVWDAGTHEEVLSLTEHASGRIAFSPDSRFLAHTDRQGAVRLYDLASRSLARELALEGGGRLDECAFSPDGRVLAVAAGDRTVRVWDIETAREVHVLRGHDGDVYSLGFLDNGSRLASAGYDRSVRVWDLASGRLALTIPSHADVWTLAVSPDGRSIAWGPNDGRVVVSSAP